MSNKQPLLSICIPTYNRAEVLKEVLNAYVINEGFDDSVELIISDNASTDHTYDVCLEFVEKYHNIHYYRNEKNILDKNFPLVLNYGKGHYLKLINDCAIPLSHSLNYMKSKIREYMEEQRPVFFTTNTIFTTYKKEEIECENLDKYVKVISTFVTYNNCFGAWYNQWHDIENKEKYADYKLMQVDWSYQLVLKNGGCILCDKLLFVGAKLGVRKGYNWFKIHLDNYYQIMMPYINNCYISKETYKGDRINLLYHFKDKLIQTYIWKYDPNNQFETKGTFSYFWKYYKKLPIFYIYILAYPFCCIYYPVKILALRYLSRVLPYSFKIAIKKCLLMII